MNKGSYLFVFFSYGSDWESIMIVDKFYELYGVWRVWGDTLSLFHMTQSWTRVSYGIEASSAKSELENVQAPDSCAS